MFNATQQWIKILNGNFIFNNQQSDLTKQSNSLIINLPYIKPLTASNFAMSNATCIQNCTNLLIHFYL